MSGITVIKQDPNGKEKWRYSGEVLSRTEKAVILQAFFDREQVSVHDRFILKRGDRFLEAYFNDRWFNLFEIHDRVDDALKGFYCNISYPAHIAEWEVIYKDLALDLIVLPDGSQVVLDEDEFSGLEISDEIRGIATNALINLQTLFDQYGNDLMAVLLGRSSIY